MPPHIINLRLAIIVVYSILSKWRGSLSKNVLFLNAIIIILIILFTATQEPLNQLIMLNFSLLLFAI
jgi:hypothetical protein